MICVVSHWLYRWRFLQITVCCKVRILINCVQIVEPIPKWRLSIVFSNWFPPVMRSKWELFKPCLPALYLKLIWCSAHVSLLCSDSEDQSGAYHGPVSSAVPVNSRSPAPPLIIRSQELLMIPSHSVTQLSVFDWLLCQHCQLNDNWQANDSLLFCNKTWAWGGTIWGDN